MNLIWCRITAKYLVQNKKQISAKKAENLHLFQFFSLALYPLDSIFYQGYMQGYIERNTICVYVWVYLGKKKGLNP